MAKQGRFSSEGRKRGGWFPGFLAGILVCTAVFCVLLLGMKQKDSDQGPDRQNVGETAAAEDTQQTAAQVTEPGTQIRVETDSQIMEATQTPQPQAVPEVTESRGGEDQPGGFDAVLDQYRRAWMMDEEEFTQRYGNESEIELQLFWLEDSCDRETVAALQQALEKPNLRTEYPYVNSMMLEMMRRTVDTMPAQELVYCYYDIDGNGEQELLVGMANGMGEIVIGMYSLAWGQARTLENTAGNRRHVTLYRDGTVGIQTSGSAYMYDSHFYRLNELTQTLDTVAQFHVNYEYPESEAVAAYETDFTSGLVPVTQFDWQPLMR